MLTFLINTLAFSALCALASYENHQVFRFSLPSPHDVTFFDNVQSELDMDIWSESALDYADVLVSPSNKNEILSKLAGLESQVLIENVQSLINKENQHSKNYRLAHGRIGGRKMNAQVLFSDYQDAETYVDFLAQFPGTQVVEIGTTYENRTIKGVRFGQGTEHVVFNGAIHAREWITSAVATFIAHKLLTNSSLIQRFTFTVIPVANVDGYAFTRASNSGRLWRKNREPNAGSRCSGTDNNRNFDFEWNAGGASTSPCSEAYRGSAPFSTKESKAIADYISGLGNVVSYFDIHSYSQMWMFPWGYTCKQRAPDYDLLYDATQKSVKALSSIFKTRYKYGDICNVIYAASGSSIDWSYGAADVKFSFALELRDTGRYGFMLPANQILPTGEETVAGIFTLWQYMANHLDGIPEPSEPVEEKPTPEKNICPIPQCYFDKSCTDCCFMNCPPQ